MTATTAAVTSFSVREATERDCDEIIRMVKELAVYLKAPEQVAIDANVLRKDGFGDKKLFHVFVAEKSATGGDSERPLVGYVMYYNTYSAWKGRTCCMEDIYVDPQWRGQGVGTALWAQLTKTAMSTGCAFVQWVVHDWNQSAIDFYKHRGAFDLSARDGEKAFRMTKAAMAEFVAKCLPGAS